MRMHPQAVKRSVSKPDVATVVTPEQKKEQAQAQVELLVRRLVALDDSHAENTYRVEHGGKVYAVMIGVPERKAAPTPPLAQPDPQAAQPPHEPQAAESPEA